MASKYLWCSLRGTCYSNIVSLLSYYYYYYVTCFISLYYKINRRSLVQTVKFIRQPLVIKQQRKSDMTFNIISRKCAKDMQEKGTFFRFINNTLCLTLTLLSGSQHCHDFIHVKTFPPLLLGLWHFVRCRFYWFVCFYWFDCFYCTFSLVLCLLIYFMYSISCEPFY